MKSENTKVSVVIPTYNSWPTLKIAISSLKEQSILPFEILVVDNGSTDGTLQNVKKNFPKVKLVKLARNTGVTGGRNAGIQNASKNSKFILFFDHDMVAGKDMLKNLLLTANKKPEYGIVTPKIYYDKDKKRIWAAGTNINLWTGQVLFRGGIDEGQFENQEEVQVAPAVLLVKKRVLDEINEFDERYFATFEDTEFCFRAKGRGFKTIYSPEAVAFHKISPVISDSQKRLLKRSFWIGRNRILFMGDYGRNFYFFLVFSFVYFLYFIQLSITQRDLEGLKKYLSGVISGIVEELISQRLLIHLPFTMYNILDGIIGEDEKTLLDVACGDGKSMSILNYGKKWKVTGIDIYTPYVNRARQRGVYEQVLIGDIRKIYKFFNKKKFDVVLISSVLDHLKKKEALDLIMQAEKLGKKVILSGLPNGFSEKHEPHFWEGDNPHQVHESSWSAQDFERIGYKLRGFGASVFIGDHRLSGWHFWEKNKSLVPVRSFVIFLENLAAYIVSPITFYFPKSGVCLLAVKETQNRKKILQ